MDLFDHFLFSDAGRDLSTALEWHHSSGMLVLSAVVAVVCSYTAFLVIERISNSQAGFYSRAWLFLGTLSLGCGVWASHFLGFLSWELPVEVHFDAKVSLFAVIPAMLASFYALQINLSQKLNLKVLARNSVLLGGGVGLTHVVGMAAMRVDADVFHSAGELIFSIISPMVLVAFAFTLGRWSFSKHRKGYVYSPRLLIAAVVMGGAIWSSHYLTMDTMYVFSDGAERHSHEGEWSVDNMAVIISIVSLLLPVLLIGAIALIQRADLNKRIKNKESHQRTILDTVADGIITIDHNGSIQSFNRAAEKIFGYAENEIIGNNVSILLPEYERAEHDEYLRDSSLYETRVLNKMRALRGQRKDGSLFRIELNVAPMEVESGRGYVGIVRDITESIEQQEAGKRNHQIQKVMSSILSHALEPISLKEVLQRTIDIIIESSVISTKPAGAIFLANDETKTLKLVAHKGLRPELQTKCAKLDYGVCHCGMAAKTKEIQFADCLDERHHITFDGIQPHGHYCVPILLQSKLLGVLNVYLQHGHKPAPHERQFLEVLSNTLAGIIDRRKNELELERFKATLDNIMDCVFMFDPETLKFFYVNSGAVAQVGYSKEALMTMTPYDIKPDYDEKRFRELIEPMISGKTNVIHFETEHSHKDGHLVPVEIVLQYLNPSGEPPRFCAVVRDITERHRIDKMKNEFVSTVSHELRTPLTSIRGSLGLILGGATGELPEQAKQLLDIAGNNTERLLLLINDILDMQKIESGEMDFNFKPVELAPFINKVIEDNAAYAEQYQVSFEVVNELKDAVIYADPARLGQVMGNLMSNAAKFSPNGSVVEISTVLRDDMIRVSVTDQGQGIPESFHSKLFDKFSQADSSDTRAIGGTGLGLSISKTLVQKHGGKIDFVSEMGVGTTFYIDLPIYTSEAENIALLDLEAGKL